MVTFTSIEYFLGLSLSEFFEVMEEIAEECKE
jgi:hypothetical protein